MERKFRFISAACILAVFLMALSVSAADDHDGWKKVKTFSDLSTATGSGGLHAISEGEYYLDNDIMVNTGFVVEDGPVTICLSGYKLSLSSGSEASATITVKNGQSLYIESCGNKENAALYTPRNSESAYAVFVTDNGKVTFSDVTIRSEHGSAVRVENGVVRLETGLIYGEQRGVYMTSGSLQVKYGKVFGHKKYGIEVDAPASEPVPTSISVSDGDVSGMSGPIIARSEGTAKVNILITGGEFEGSVGSCDCVSIDAPNHDLTITGGTFFGEFPSGMNASVTGGRFSKDDVKVYVPSTHICRKTEDTKYRYEVDEKRTYTVIFTDGLGNTLKTDHLREGETAMPPADPVRKGYVFDGWDKDLTGLFYSPSPVTVNAKWKEAPVGTGDVTGTNEAVKPVVRDLKKVTGLNLTAGKKRITVRWKKPKKKVRKTFQKYEVQYGLKKDFSDAKTVYVKKTASKVILRKLKKTGKYYVRIRAYRDDGDVLHVSKWKKKAVRVK